MVKHGIVYFARWISDKKNIEADFPEIAMFDYQSCRDPPGVGLSSSVAPEGAHFPFREKHGGVVTNHVVGYGCESKLRDTM